MTSSGSFNSTENDSWRDDFLGFPVEILQKDFAHLGLTLTASPDLLPQPLPTHTPFDFPFQTNRQPIHHPTRFFDPQDCDPPPTVLSTVHQPHTTLNAGRSLMSSQGHSSVVVNGTSLKKSDSNFSRTQSSHTGPSAYGAPPHPDVHVSFEFRGWPPQFDRLPVQYCTSAFNPQHSALTPTVSPTSPQLYANAIPSYSFMPDDLQRRSYIVANGSSPAHVPIYNPQAVLTHAQPHYYDSQGFGDQNQPSSATMATFYQTQPPSASVKRNSSSVLPHLAPHPMAPRPPLTQVPSTPRIRQANHPIPNSSYRSSRTSSLPVSSTSPEQTLTCLCQWLMSDGTTCGAPISVATVPEHLATHGIKNKGHSIALQCEWLGCRLRKGQKTMKRESIVRHVREVHLRSKRAL